MNSTTIPYNYCISASILVISGTALILNMVSVPLAFRTPFKDSVFGVFLLFKSINCAIVAAAFVYWSFPLSIQPSVFNFVPLVVRQAIGIICITADGNATFFTFLVSVNRLVVLWNVRSRHDDRNVLFARIFSIAAILAGIGVSGFIHLHDELYPSYKNEWFDWGTGKSTPLGAKKIYYFYSLRIVSLALDIVAFVKLSQLLRKLSGNQNFSFDIYFFYLITLQHLTAFANTVFYTQWFDFPWMTTGISYALRYGMWQMCYLLDG
ncbi:hypothetical protein L596_025333 [Steinernema carpocapsae]|uniref:7TM GPCR serpentine receptor class x (Srx) domain-containing protein n=1 Tax=Steinernema carpocapsae TaxID=34508 RepID=A0A4U5M7H2_STECR|nr:hypothetical protein L596_025333 [Steinernema carpocapsae]